MNRRALGPGRSGEEDQGKLHSANNETVARSGKSSIGVHGVWDRATETSINERPGARWASSSHLKSFIEPRTARLLVGEKATLLI